MRWTRRFMPHIVSKERDTPDGPERRWIAPAPHHIDMWRWLWALRLGVRPDPIAFVANWPRGHAKSSIVEMGVTFAGATRRRRYALYVCGSQSQADEHVDNIQSLMEGAAYSASYPDAAYPEVTREGRTASWKQAHLRAINGFTVVGAGLDRRLRGRRADDARPDFIIFDDIDELDDTPATTKKKMDKIFRSILYAGSGVQAVMFVQNLIIDHGVAAQILDHPNEYLTNRHQSGPIKALENFDMARDTWQDEHNFWHVTGGEPTWPEGMGFEECEVFINTSYSGFPIECQQDRLASTTLVHPNFSKSSHGISRSRLYGKIDGIWVGGIDFGGEGASANPSACVLALVVTHSEAPGVSPGQIILMDEWQDTSSALKPAIRKRQGEWMIEKEVEINRMSAPGEWKKILWVADRTGTDAQTILRDAGLTVVSCLGQQEASRESRVAMVAQRFDLRGDGRPGLVFLEARVRRYPDQVLDYRRIIPPEGSDRGKKPIRKVNDHLVNCVEYIVERVDRVGVGAVPGAAIRPDY